MVDAAAEKGFTKAIWAGPLGTLARLLWFLLLCSILFVIGLVKAAFFGPLATFIFFCGAMAVVIGLWPAHLVIMVRAVAMTKKLGVVLKIFLISLLPILLLLWPIGVGVGSILAGLGYGFGQPLVATFEAVGENRENKFYNTFVWVISALQHPPARFPITSLLLASIQYIALLINVSGTSQDGTMSTVTGSFKFVRDFYDFVYHSISDSVEEFRLGEPKNGKPIEIKLHELPLCAIVGLVGVLVDTPAIGMVALCKMPIMLFKGWRRLLGDLITRNGSCSEAACVPLAGLALVLWPLIVVASALTAFLCSPFFGLYSAVVVYEEMSYKCGLKYVVAVVAEFDEYSSDILHSHAGSCLPRPKYRKNKGTSKVNIATATLDTENVKGKSEPKPALEIPQLNTQKSLRQTIKEVKLVHIMDNKYQSIDIDGKSLINSGVLKNSDIDAALNGDKINGKIMLDCLPAYTLLRHLMRTAKSNTSGFLLNDGTEVTPSNRPRDRLFEWFFEPLLNLKDQLRSANLQESEERFLEKIVLMGGDTERMGRWQNGGVEPEDAIRKGELLAIARRIQGISTSLSRIPTHRRRMENLLKNFQAYVESKERTGRNLSSQTDLPARSKTMKKMTSNVRSFMKEGSKHFLSTTVQASEKRGNSEEIGSNGDQAV